MPALIISLTLLMAGGALAFGLAGTSGAGGIATVGMILMVVGAIVLLLSMLFLMSFSPLARPAGDDRAERERP